MWAMLSVLDVTTKAASIRLHSSCPSASHRGRYVAAGVLAELRIGLVADAAIARGRPPPEWREEAARLGLGPSPHEGTEIGLEVEMMKQEKARALIDGALDRLGEALDRGFSDTMKSYLAAMARLRQYSWGNILLIALARPDATHVAGYRTWQKLGRQVNRGEKGIVILAPIVMRRRKEDDGEDGEDEDESKENRVFGFKAAHVFDVSQTSGEPLPEAARVQGEPGAYLPRMRELVAECGIELTYSDRLGRADGASCGGRIVIRTGLSSAEELSVIAHELAHLCAYFGYVVYYSHRTAMSCETTTAQHITRTVRCRRKPCGPRLQSSSQGSQECHQRAILSPGSLLGAGRLKYLALFDELRL